MDNLKFDSGVRITRQYKIRLNTLKQNGVNKQLVTINPMADKKIESTVKCKDDESRKRKVPEPVVIRRGSKRRMQSAKVDSNLTLNKSRPIKTENEANNEPIIVYSNKDNPVTISKATDIKLSNSSKNLPSNKTKCDVNSDKVQVLRKQVSLNETAFISQPETSSEAEECQTTREVLPGDRFETFNASNQSSDASRNQCLVLEPSTKRPKTRLGSYGEFGARMQTEKVAVTEKSQTLSDVSSNFEVSELRNRQFTNRNDSNNNIGLIQLNTNTSNGKKVIALEVLKLGINRSSQFANNTNNQESGEIICEKNITNRNSNVRVNDWRTTTIQNPSAKLPSLVAQPIKKVILVQLDPAAVNKILTGSSLKFNYPIVNQHKPTFDDCNSINEQVQDNCEVENSKNLPRPQRNDSEANRSSGESPTACVPKLEALSEEDYIDTTPFLFVAVDGS